MISHLSQVAAKRKLNIRDQRVKVAGKFHEQGSVLRGDAEGSCDHFEIEILIESDEPVKTIEELITLARQMCFTEKALTGNVSFNVNRKLNGEKL